MIDSAGSSTNTTTQPDQRGRSFRHLQGRSGWVKVAGAVGSSVVVVANIFGEYCTQVALVDDQHAVGQFGSQGADKPFGEAVRSWAPWRNSDYLDAHIGQDGSSWRSDQPRLTISPARLRTTQQPRQKRHAVTAGRTDHAGQRRSPTSGTPQARSGDRATTLLDDFSSVPPRRRQRACRATRRIRVRAFDPVPQCHATISAR